MRLVVSVVREAWIVPVEVAMAAVLTPMAASCVCMDEVDVTILLIWVCSEAVETDSVPVLAATFVTCAWIVPVVTPIALSPAMRLVVSVVREAWIVPVEVAMAAVLTPIAASCVWMDEVDVTILLI